MLSQDGVWLSLVERYVRDVEAAGSNPVTPIENKADTCVSAWENRFAIPLNPLHCTCTIFYLIKTSGNFSRTFSFSLKLKPI